MRGLGIGMGEVVLIKVKKYIIKFYKKKMGLNFLKKTRSVKKIYFVVRA